MASALGDRGRLASALSLPGLRSIELGRSPQTPINARRHPEELPPHLYCRAMNPCRGLKSSNLLVQPCFVPVNPNPQLSQPATRTARDPLRAYHVTLGAGRNAFDQFALEVFVFRLLTWTVSAAAKWKPARLRTTTFCIQRSPAQVTSRSGEDFGMSLAKMSSLRSCRYSRSACPVNYLSPVTENQPRTVSGSRIMRRQMKRDSLQGM